ncbi:zinc transporter 11 [Momordica charantia]|uniref:Zinc transporter 11 n=1 Tax=Momordica charantia TaxID=3673 RepID=A0A6J1CD53_MOMCH|nr:zinc transporter 11 [Momordica charantia]
MARSLLLFSLLFLLLSSAAAHGGSHDDGDGDAPTAADQAPNLRSKPLLLVKIGCLILIFVGTFIPGISPYFFKWNDGFLVLGTQFAGGVFLGTAMMHFLSDANETFGDLTDRQYPFAFMLACAGFLMTMAADCVISHLYRKQTGDSSIGGYGGDLELRGAATSPPKFQGQNGSSSHHPSPALTSMGSFGDSILLIVALCFHSIFEGIAIGVAETEADAWRALWTISLHKVFAAIAMGIALLRMIPDRPFLSTVAYAFAFAISSPIGVGIGIIIDATTQGAVADWIFAISMGLACGVFIYVSVNHLLSKGYTPREAVLVDNQNYKFVAVLLGIGVIAVVMIWDT